MSCISRSGCAWPNLCEANGYCMRATAPDDTPAIPQTSKEQNYRNALLRIIQIQEDCGESYEELFEAAQVARAVLGGFDCETTARTNQGDSGCRMPGDPPDYDSNYTVAELAALCRTKDRHIARLEGERGASKTNGDLP